MIFKVIFPRVLNLQRFVPSRNQSCKPVKLAYNIYKPSHELDRSLRPVIFLHYLSSSKENWMYIPQKIADVSKRMAYTLDIRNHGDSEWNDVFNSDALVCDTLHFMDNLNIEKAIIVGHCYGGTIGAQMALTMPNRVEGFIVEEGFIRPLYKKHADFLLQKMNLWFEGTRIIPKEMTETEAKKFMVDYVYNNLFPGIVCENKKEYLYETSITLKRTSTGHFEIKHNYESIKRAVENYEMNMREPQGIYEGPTCYIYGALSPFKFYKDEEYIRKNFPRLEMIKFEGGGHNIHIKFPNKFINIVLKYILNMK